MSNLFYITQGFEVCYLLDFEFLVQKIKNNFFLIKM